jgi:hypothetical protein
VAKAAGNLTTSLSTRRQDRRKRKLSPADNSGSYEFTPAAATLTLTSEIPEFLRTGRQREQYRRNSVRRFLQRLTPSARELPPRTLYQMYCKKFESDPTAKEFKISPTSYSTFLRALGKKR